MKSLTRAAALAFTLAPLAPFGPFAMGGRPAAAMRQDEPRRPVIYYDYVEDGVLKGGVVVVDPTNPLMAEIPTLERAPASPFVTLVNNGPSANRIDLVFVGDGYTSGELGSYAAHVDGVYPTFFSAAPLDEYSTYFNVHRVDVVSAESGVDNDPSLGIARNTALDMGFWCGGTERLLCVNTFKASNQAASAPDVDQILAVANSSKYGGAGYSNLGTLSGANGSTIEVALHEFGHSFAGLADEYDYGGPTTWPGGEPSEPNVSTHEETSMAANQKKWFRWLSLPAVSTFEGARYSENGIYRPTSDSKMRSLGRPFQAVNTEQFIRSMYMEVDPIDAASAPGIYTFEDVLDVTPMRPLTHALEIQWALEGIPILGATGESFDLSTLVVPDGVYTVSVTVVDNTNLVQNETYRANLMTSTRSWTAISSRRFLLAPGIKATISF